MVKVKVRLFSMYRDAVGSPEVELEVDRGCTVQDLIGRLLQLYPRLGEVFAEVEPIVLINGVRAEPNSAIDEGYEIAIAPPASGGTHSVEVGLFSNDISLDRILEEVLGAGSGAVVMFVGVVKDVVDGRRVYELVYEAYEPYASKVLEKIALEELSKYGLSAVKIYHRVGPAKPREKTVVIAVSAKGRREAFQATSEILERVKSEVPIYKLERRDDGEYWVVGDGIRIPRTIPK